MGDRLQRRWSFWVTKGAVAMATLAAIALAVTVGLTQRALDNAADVMVRGDGDMLVAGLVVDLSDAEWPLTSGALAAVLVKHEADGLRYVALVDRDEHRVLADAGTATIVKRFNLPGELARQGRRARLVDALARLHARTRRDLSELTRW